ncbi:uracil phosphoribosyltransferase [Gulosibacter molinativorax]|uniref:Uracil phosphoribosyltransferase n=1 Tax=Gulosibacter molinativorax TaxID=256821 RepID=A0ABT7CB17_9MICO|nr:uracil phosphoribosyltransferase [Gulosibacter molinativorax]MDJ1372283.1 uracil phosphoribosyltransferase [Gulosibacter molinativorax]QUY63377.1 Uracil phosphoribosyltransferase [Gulosibacter molinativorax]
MQLHVANHPLIDHKMTILRDERTESPVFRSLVSELVNLLTYEASRDLHVEDVAITTPVTDMVGKHVSRPLPLAVPIIRAGLGMLDGFLQLMPHCEVGFVGMRRNEDTLQPETYAKRLPDDVSDRQCFVLDPMLATGGSLAATVEFLIEGGAKEITAICLVAAPEGVALMQERFPDDNVRIIVAALDEGLNEQGFIVPGLGDAGDRLYGAAE